MMCPDDKNILGVIPLDIIPERDSSSEAREELDVSDPPFHRKVAESNSAASDESPAKEKCIVRAAASAETTSFKFLSAVCNLVQAHDADLRRLQEENAELRRQLRESHETSAELVPSRPLACSSTLASEAQRVGNTVQALIGLLRAHRQRSCPSSFYRTFEQGEQVSPEATPATPWKRHITGGNTEPSQAGCQAGTFKVRRYWKQSRRNLSGHTDYKRSVSFGDMHRRSRALENTEKKPILQRFVLHPDCTKRALWDVLCAILLLYDVAAIPFINAFDPGISGFVHAAAIGIFFIWFLDMFASMLTGYHNGRDLIMSPRKTLQHYLQTWFAFDVVVVTLDAVMLFTDAGVVGGVFRAFRASRFLRAMRLVRLVKFRKVLQQIQDKIMTESYSILFGIVLIVVGLVLANHVVACLWYSVGSQEGVEVTWVIENDMQSKTILYQYVTSLHWSLTQFTPASMEVAPTNVQERTFAVVALLFAMLVFSSFVSILTASIAQLRNIRNVESRQFWMLRRYLRDWSVSSQLSGKILSYCEFAYENSVRRVQSVDVALLRLLSTQIEAELKHETLSMHLRGHAFFRRCRSDARFFSKALTSSFVARDETVFHFGARGALVVFLTHGDLDYTPGPPKDEMVDNDKDNDNESVCSIAWDEVPAVRVRPGEWVAEPALWTRWLHCGDLNSVLECELITVDTKAFGGCFNSLSETRVIAVAYAAAFVQRLNEVEEEWLSDLTIDTINPESLLDASEVDVASVASSRSEEAGLCSTVARFTSRFVGSSHRVSAL